jgi:hypothetical protein
MQSFLTSILLAEAVRRNTGDEFFTAVLDMLLFLAQKAADNHMSFAHHILGHL